MFQNILNEILHRDGIRLRLFVPSSFRFQCDGWRGESGEIDDGDGKMEMNYIGRGSEEETDRPF